MTTLYGGSGDDVFHISSESQQTVVVGDTLKSTRASDDGLSNMPVLETTNTNYADVVELDWGYDASEITQLGNGYRIYNEDLDATVDIYDVEVLKFKDDNVAGGWDTRYLTDGAPVGRDSWMFGHAGKDIDYGDGSKVRFVLTDGGTGDKASLLQVYAELTTTVTTTESYTYYQRGTRISETPRKGYSKKTGTREVETEHTSDELIWQGDKTSVDVFTFADNVSVNVINIADKDWNDQPIEMTLGTDGIDLIFGNDSANLIDAGLGDDIIFGGDGDDVIIGGEGDDILLGGDGDDTIRGDTVTDQDAALSHFAALTDFDDSQLSIDNSGMSSGGDDVILGGDGVDDIDSGEGSNLVSSGRLDLNNDGDADLDIVKEFMEDNNIDNKDIFDNDDWV